MAEAKFHGKDMAPSTAELAEPHLPHPHPAPCPTFRLLYGLHGAGCRVVVLHLTGRAQPEAAMTEA